MRRRLTLALGAAIFAAIGPLGSAAPQPPQGFLMQFEWPTDDPRLGGLSGIELSADGLAVTLLSDHGSYARGQIRRDGAGQITGIDLPKFQLLKARVARPLTRGRSDAEGLAIAADGATYISLEGASRILRYARLDGPAENLPSPKAFETMQQNSSLEALAIDAEGRLYTMPERSGAVDRPFPIYRYQNGQWDAKLSLPRGDGYMPVGADFGPDGKLYILMREFHGIAGFSSKLIRTTVGGDALGAIEVLFESPVGFHDNLEGLAIWRDSAGDLRATMVADNNYLPFLSSGIVEYRLPD